MPVITGAQSGCFYCCFLHEKIISGRALLMKAAQDGLPTVHLFSYFLVNACGLQLKNNLCKVKYL